MLCSEISEKTLFLEVKFFETGTFRRIAVEQDRQPYVFLLENTAEQRQLYSGPLFIRLKSRFSELFRKNRKPRGLKFLNETS